MPETSVVPIDSIPADRRWAGPKPHSDYVAQAQQLGQSEALKITCADRKEAERVQVRMAYYLTYHRRQHADGRRPPLAGFTTAVRGNDLFVFRKEGK